MKKKTQSTSADHAGPEQREAARLESLARYAIMDTAPEAVFDHLTRLAARRFDMPIALVSLLDEKRQWFKSHYGLDATETDRKLAFCAHAIERDEVMVVADASKDARFADNDLVTGDPNIRFYAGAPLVTPDGHALGTICVIDRAPHPEFGDAQKKELAELASMVMEEMEIRLTGKQLKEDKLELAKAQRALEQARTIAEQAINEKRQFITSISHELRTPMNGILGMAYLLADTSLNPKQREYIETINHSAQNLLLLINDVLDISKIEAKELILDRSGFDVKHCFTQTIKLLMPLANKKNINLHYTLGASVPSRIVGDQARFTQIITNLVGNAIKFTDEGTVTANLEYDAATHMLSGEVIDTGIGIPESKRSAIFEKFVQGDAKITQKYGGTGLGLAITKQLIGMLGGQIAYESIVGKGTRFWFTLPALENDTVVQPLHEERVPAKARDRIAASSARVLIAEDHPVNRHFLEALLHKFGFEQVESVSDGVEAMEKHRLQHFDMIFMDCRMPNMDGYETSRGIRAEEKLRSNGKHVPIIAMTANALAGDRDACFAAGMDAYMSKPIDPARLHHLLGDWFTFPHNLSELAQWRDSDVSETLPINPQQLELVADTDEEKSRILTLFFKLADDIVTSMEQFKRSSEAAQWKNASHNLRGSAANLGMQGLVRLCLHAESTPSLTYEQRGLVAQDMRAELARIHQFITHQHPTWLEQNQ